MDSDAKAVIAANDGSTRQNATADDAWRASAWEY
jgi:hypothetical protein